MKPSNWKKLAASSKMKAGQRLMSTPRGYWVVSKALALGVALARAQGDEDEAQDMEMLRETLFSMFQMKGADDAVLHAEDDATRSSGS